METLKDLFKQVIDLYENAIKDDFFWPTPVGDAGFDQAKQGNWVAPLEYQTSFIVREVNDRILTLKTELNKIDNPKEQLKFAKRNLKNIEKRIRDYTYYLPDNVSTKDDEPRSYQIMKFGHSKDKRRPNSTLIEHLKPKQIWKKVTRGFYHIQTNGQVVFVHMIASIYFWITLKEIIEFYTPKVKKIEMTKKEIDKLIDEFVQCLLQEDQLKAIGIYYYKARLSELEEGLSPGSNRRNLWFLHLRLLTVLPQESEYQNFWVKDNSGSIDTEKIFKEIYNSLTIHNKNILYREPFIWQDEESKRMGVPIVYLAATAYRYLQQLQQIVNNGSLPQPINNQKPELKIDQIALKYVYEGLQITRKNSIDIAKEHGHNSGEKLFQRFTHYSSTANRKGKPTLCTPKKLDNKIKLIESVIKLLPSEKQQRARDEVSILKGIQDDEYQ